MDKVVTGVTHHGKVGIIIGASWIATRDDVMDVKGGGTIIPTHLTHLFQQPCLPTDPAFHVADYTAKCSRCGWCYVYCPTGSVIEEATYFSINLDYCKGCGICASVCPNYAIALVREGE